MKNLGSGTKWLGVLVIILSVFTVGQSYYYTRQDAKRSGRDREITACQTQYNKDFAIVLTQRAAWNEQDRTELNKMLSGVLTGPTEEIRKKYLVDYIAQVDRNDQLRAQNPLPKLTDRHC